MNTASIITCALAAAPAMLQAAEFNDYESLLRESIGIRAELADTLAGITDQASAKAALPRVRELMGQYTELAAKIRAVPQPDESSKMALERTMREEFAPVRTKMTANIMRLHRQRYFGEEELQRALAPLVNIQPAPPQLQRPKQSSLVAAEEEESRHQGAEQGQAGALPLG